MPFEAQILKMEINAGKETVLMKFPKNKYWFCIIFNGNVTGNDFWNSKQFYFAKFAFQKPIIVNPKNIIINSHTVIKIYICKCLGNGDLKTKTCHI